MWQLKHQLLKSLRVSSLFRNYSKENPRKFTVNGAMGEREKEVYFYINPGETNKKELIPSIEEGQYIMFYGKSK
jgi:hypothetical protein